jgi:Hint domain
VVSARADSFFERRWRERQPFTLVACDGADGGVGTSSGGNGDKGCCLLKGTRISTPSGERMVEDLLIGDEVLTLSGSKAVKWIGYGKYTSDLNRPWQASVMPIRVARAAIADQVPIAISTSRRSTASTSTAC